MKARAKLYNESRQYGVSQLTLWITKVPVGRAIRSSRISLDPAAETAGPRTINAPRRGEQPSRMQGVITPMELSHPYPVRSCSVCRGTSKPFAAALAMAAPRWATSAAFTAAA